MPAPHEDWEAAFWAKVREVPSGCWEWTGSRMAGYGQFGTRTAGCRRGLTTAAHRIAYELVVGQVRDGLELDHVCRNRACCNPAHLEPVTHRENVLRGVSPMALNARKEACPRGHAYAPANTYVTKAGKRQCRACHADRQRARRAAA
jgi:hypothetical protein